MPENGPAAAPDPRGVGEDSDESLLRLEAVTKRFPSVVALRDVDFDLRAGEVHVLLGENGAGKSTLVKMLSGALEPDSGRVFESGREVRIASPHAAELLGIATIYQEFNLVPEMSVGENILLGRQPRRFGTLNKRRMHTEARAWLDRVGLDVDPRRPVGELGVARRQLVEIAKALSLDAGVLVLDEPTAALTSGEAQRLFTIMRELRASGVGLVFISHHLEEIREIGDRVTVLRDGGVAGRTTATATHDELVHLMVGRTIEAQYPRVRPAKGGPRLRVRGLTRRGAFEDVSFDVHAGEIVGLAGLVGAGRTEVARAIFGADSYDSGAVEVDGHHVQSGSVLGALRAGLGLVPEDRKGQGLVMGRPVAENLALTTLRAASYAGFVDRQGQRRRAQAVAERLDIRMSGLDQPAATLSGGNQQKVVIGKWLSARSKALVLDEPTRGVDVGAKVEIYELMNELTADGHALLVISSELPEILGMSDRVLVMAGGRMRGELTAEQATQDAVMTLAVQGG